MNVVAWTIDEESLAPDLLHDSADVREQLRSNLVGDHRSPAFRRKHAMRQEVSEGVGHYVAARAGKF